MEERGLTKGNTPGQARAGRSAGKSVSTSLERVREAAYRNKAQRFTSLLHHVTPEALRVAAGRIPASAAPGADGVRKQDFMKNAEENLRALHERVHRGAHRVTPARRVEIPKPDGRKRPLGIAAFEDKVVQGALKMVLNAIYETEFYGFSYGFRPGVGQHDALDALSVLLVRGKVSYVFDADIRDYFNTIDHDRLLEFIERKIGDERVLREIRKVLKVGIIKDGEWWPTEEGTAQGATISPLLANIYLHYVYDDWVVTWRQTKARGDVYVVRYADDTIVGFQYQEDALRFKEDLARRFAEYNLSLHPEKTRLIEFGRFAARDRKRRGEGKPETFDFLGFTHYCATTRTGKFKVGRKTVAKKQRDKLAEQKQTLYKNRNKPIPEQTALVRAVLEGHMAYYAVPGNLRAERAFQRAVLRHWLRALRRRGDKRKLTWARFLPLATAALVPIRNRHEYPGDRFDARIKTRGRSPVR